MTADEAERLELGGRYADYLRRSLEEGARAAIEGRPADEALWAAHAARACRRIGKAVDALGHAARAAELARGSPALAPLVRHAQGVALRCARRYDESLAALREAVELAPSASAAELQLEIADTALEAGAAREAEAALGRAAGLREPRLIAWALYLRTRTEPPRASEPRLAAAHEIARPLGCPELRWQILWRLSERPEAERVRDDLVWCAVGLLAGLAEPLDPEDATPFWRCGPRRVFVDQAQRRYGASFLHRIMLGGATPRDPSEILVRDLGFAPASLAEWLPPT